MSNHHDGPRESGLSTPVGTRRRFFQWMTAAAISIISVGLAIPLISYVISPARKRREQSWVEVGKVDELSIQQPKQLSYVASVRDGYVKTTAQKAVWAVKMQNGEVRAFAPQCPHLGCGYRWVGPDHKFKCPCHGSVYDVGGSVLDGPAPRPLDRLPIKIENGNLYVIYKEFKAGLTNPVEL